MSHRFCVHMVRVRCRSLLPRGRRARPQPHPSARTARSLTPRRVAVDAPTPARCAPPPPFAHPGVSDDRHAPSTPIASRSRPRPGWCAPRLRQPLARSFPVSTPRHAAAGALTPRPTRTSAKFTLTRPSLPPPRLAVSELCSPLERTVEPRLYPGTQCGIYVLTKERTRLRHTYER